MDKATASKSSVADANASPNPPTVMFAIFQTSNRANGGVESISQIIDRFPSDSCVVTQRETEVNRRWQSTGKEVHVFKLPYTVGHGFWKASLSVKLRRLKSYWSTNRDVVKLIRENEVEVLHCNDPAPFWHVVPAAMLCRIPVLLNRRDTRAKTSVYSRFKFRLLLRLANRLLVLSREMAEFFSEMAGKRFSGGLKSKINYIYSVVDTELMKPADHEERTRLRSELGIDENEFAIGFVAAFNNLKNQFQLLDEAAEELLQRCDNSRLHFVGDFRPESDQYAARCNDLVNASPIKQSVNFAGYSSEVYRWYRALDVVIVPTRQEGLARCMIEAIACGTPVVSFDVCSAREILESHDCGIVVPQGDYVALIDAVESLAVNESMRERMGRNGRQAAVELFDSERVFSEYVKLYQDLASGL